MVACQTPTYELRAKNAILYASATDYVGQNGIALRQSDGRVFFCADHTGLWTDITDVELGRIQMCGDVALDIAARIADGDLVLKASRTLQAA
jgi:hypothetical protein